MAKGRPQAKIITPRGGKPFPQFYTPKTTVDWEDRVGEVALTQLRQTPTEGEGEDFVLPLDGYRILMTVRFNLAKPVSYPKSIVHHTKKPDVDNLVKAVLDGLVKGRVLGDDNCVTDLMVSKRYVEPGHPEGVEVDITCLPTEMP